MSNNSRKKGLAPNAKVCSNCLTPEDRESAPKLSACARCGLVLYCGRECQRAHWSAGHKQQCIAKADRAPQQQDPSRQGTATASRAAAAGEECSICLDSLSNEETTTLDCSHRFHFACVEELRNFGVTQTCPLCRTPLPPGPEKVFEEALRRYLVIDRQIDRGETTWRTLSAEAKRELDAVVVGMKAAAEGGYDQAQVNLGILYENGRGVPQSYKETAKWFRKAADQGHAKAMYKMGLLYQDGQGVPQDDVEGARWFEKAASEEGLMEAIFVMGCLYRDGRGVEQNDVKAARCTKVAAQQGYAPAQYNLGSMFAKDLGTEQSHEWAARLFKLAAKQGHPEAQFALGIAYVDGRGVPESDTKAAKWFRRAADQGVEQAVHNLRVLGKSGAKKERQWKNVRGIRGVKLKKR